MLRQFNGNHFFPSEYKRTDSIWGGCLVEGGVRASVIDTGKKVSMTGFPSTWEHGVGRGLGKFPESAPAEGFWYHCLQGNSKYLPSFLFYETELDPCFVAKGTISLSLVFTKDCTYNIQRSQQPSFFFQEF